MHCTLLVPDLLLQSAPDAPLYRDLNLPALSRLLGRGKCTNPDAPDMVAWLCTAFAVPRQCDWPVAPLTLLCDGGEPGTSYWLRSDPVHLRAQRSQLMLTEGRLLALTADEARELSAALNAYFNGEGLFFSAPHPARWYLRVAQPPALHTCTLAEATATDINDCLPRGEAGLVWHRRLNEIQMLLHTHPVNEAREARDLPAINSVWLWGGGIKPSPPCSPYTHIWSRDALARGLAAAAGMPCNAAPENAAALFAPTESTALHHLAVLPQLRDAIHDRGLEQWRDEIVALERDWLAPLERGLRAGQLSSLAIVVPGGNRGVRCDITRSDLWKFWRPARSLEKHG